MIIPRFLRWTVLTAGLAAALVAAEPINLSTVKQAALQYAESGEYGRDIAVMCGYARDWITARADKKLSSEKLALVLDIDETALSNLQHMEEMDFGYIPNLWDAWVADHTAPPLSPVLEVFQQARRLDVAVFFISGRREKDRPGTEKNLKAVGYGDYAQVLLKPDDFVQSTQVFKTATRAKLESEGWTVIANIGDQQSDLDGGASERTFKLPNPYYLIK